MGLTRIGVVLVGIGRLLFDRLRHLARATRAPQLRDGGGSGTSIALYIVAVGLGVVGGRRPKQARRLATKLGSENAPARAELHSLLNDPVSRAANYSSAALVVAILVLTVFKP